MLQSVRFTATLSYKLSTHHPSQRMSAEIKLCDDFKFFVHVVNSDNISLLTNMVDIRTCRVGLEPAEVAQNRKRRWSKKFPIVISCPSGLKKFKVYLFSPTAREKEDWFRRIKSAASGHTTQQLIQRQREFFGYMEKYFPQEMLKSLSLRPTKATAAATSSARRQALRHHHNSRLSNSQQLANTLVQFSKSADNDEVLPEESETGGGVNITRKASSSSSQHASHASHQSSISSNHQPGSLQSTAEVRGQDSTSVDTPLSSTSVDEHGFEHVQHPSASTSSLPSFLASHPNQWLNSLAARLCWDVWHEKRWKDWVMTRIQKKLIRIKTPSFMESLQLINIDIGNDMPMINQLIGGPRLDLRGIWVYLDVTYQGKFVMTIETKMKFGVGVRSRAGTGGNDEEGGKQMTAITRSKDDSR